jgi:hypothetical protein
MLYFNHLVQNLAAECDLPKAFIEALQPAA